ncbi:MAG: aminotransferase class I/II-fold pyridoxal phosphate-dependent enzyme [Rhodobacter sp.]|nr:aminotransferase class I/II-fold pyridoxal phosphate-dependent enzyme [Rhodobacter sp.]
MDEISAKVPTPSPRLAGLPGYGRGRAGAAQVFAHRLGSNEAPDAPDRAVRQAVAAAFDGANRYPDLRGETLGAALALRHGLKADQVAVAAGSIVLLDQLMRAYCDGGDEIVTAWRSYEAYPILAGLAGARLVEVALNSEHCLDAAAMRTAVGSRTRAVLICNPNNPTGTALAPEALDGLLDALPADLLILLDEAYCDFDGSAEAVRAAPARRLARHPNLVILRTFSKAWGLAGLRAGYAMAAPEIIAAIHAVAPPFPLPGVALAAVLAAIEQPEAVAARVDRNAAERARLTSGIAALGLPVAQSAANFVWLPVGPRAEALNAHLAGVGIAARCFAREGVRITTGTAADTDAVLDALARFRPND